MNKAEIEAATTDMLGITNADAVLQASLDDAIVWAQDELARRLGLTYIESDPILVAGQGIVSLPDSCILPERVWFIGDAVPVPMTVTVPEYEFAGAFNIAASVPPQPAGYQIQWSGTGISYKGNMSGTNVVFDIGYADQLAAITATAIDGLGNVITGTGYIKVVPYTSAISITTIPILPEQAVVVEMDLGWQYKLVQAEVNDNCWVRIYNTMGDLNVDIHRDITQDPPVGTHIVWEGIFIPTLLLIPDAPDVMGTNGDVPRTKKAYVNITNVDKAVTKIITLTVTRTETQTSGVF